MWRTIPPDRTGRRLRLLLAGVLCLGLIALAAAAADLSGLVGDRVPAPPWWWLAGYALLVAVGQHLKAPIRIRSTGYGGCWTDTVVLVGLASLPMSWVILATAPGVLAARLIGRRQQPTVIAFSMARNSVTALVGGLVLAASSAAGETGTVAQLGWLAAAFLAMTAVGKSLVVPAVMLASRAKVAGRLLADWDIELAALGAKLAVALAAVLVLAQQPQLIYGLPLLVLLAHVWHEQWLRAREERRAWQDLATATAALVEVELDTVLRRAVTGGARLFSADAVEVELWPVSPPRLVRGHPDVITFDGDPADAPPEVDLPDVHEMRLHGCAGQPDVGVLRLRFRNGVRLSEREQAMLARYTSAVEAAVRNATAHGLLRHADPGPTKPS